MVCHALVILIPWVQAGHVGQVLELLCDSITSTLKRPKCNQKVLSVAMTVTVVSDMMCEVGLGLTSAPINVHCCAGLFHC